MEVPPRLNPLAHIDLHQKIDFCSLTPAQLDAILEDTYSRRQVEKIEKILLGGAPITSHTLEQINKIKPVCYHSYGMTETISHVAVRNLSERDEFFEAIGDVRFRLNENAQLIIQAPSILESELLTNDIAQLDGPRLMKWKGRIDNVVNSGGVKLHLEEIEQKLKKHYDGNFYLCKDRDERFGEKIILVSKAKVSEDVLSLLPKLERPREQYVTPEFAYTENGKLLRLTPQQLMKL